MVNFNPNTMDTMLRQGGLGGGKEILQTDPFIDDDLALELDDEFKNVSVITGLYILNECYRYFWCTKLHKKFQNHVLNKI